MTLSHANIIYMLWEPERRGLRFGKPIRLVLKERALQGLRREVDVNFQENAPFSGSAHQFDTTSKKTGLFLDARLKVGTKQVVRALWVELARLVLSGRPWFRPTTLPLVENCY